MSSSSTRPSPHFTWDEFRCHDGTPLPVRAHDDVRRLCRRYLEPLRARYGAVTVISGYRTAQHNRDVLGAPRSYHRVIRDRPGIAADVRCERGLSADWYALLAALNPGGLGHYPEHVHVDNREGERARW